MLCPFKKKSKKEIFDFGHRTEETIESFCKCEKEKCAAYNEAEERCGLIFKEVYLLDAR